MTYTYYETGYEEPEILGSGSSFSNVITTGNEKEAFRLFRDASRRNYLYKITWNNKARKIESWNEYKKIWE